MFEVKNLSFAYDRNPILRDVSFFVSPGETVSVLGANGAGKTTLLKVLATLAVPTSGQILADGRNAFRNLLEFRRQIGYLPEKIALYDDMTVKEYLAYRCRIKGEPDRRVRRRVNEAAEFCRITEQLRHPIGILSAGMKKRVALADTILLRPRVLLLDDFLAGLDFAMRSVAGEIISNAASFSSVIVTGHGVDDLADWTTRFLILRDGMITATIPTAGVEMPVLREHVADAIGGGA